MEPVMKRHESYAFEKNTGQWQKIQSICEVPTKRRVCHAFKDTQRNKLIKR